MSEEDSVKKLDNYIFSSDELISSIEKDIKSNNRKISDSTIIKLSKMVAASNEMAKMIEMVFGTPGGSNRKH